MAYDKTASVGTTAVTTEARDAILAKGTYGHRWFQQIWSGGVTTNTGEPTLATMVQSYTLDLPAVEAALANLGARGWEINELFGALSAQQPVDFEVTEVGDNRWQFTGIWPGGTLVRVRFKTTDPQGDVDVWMRDYTLPPGQHSGAVVASVLASLIDSEPHVQSVAQGNVLVLTPADPDYQLETSVSA